MSTRILVGYATRNGSTVGVAEKIGATLAERGFAVDVKSLADKPVPAAYDAVVLGSAINGGKWLPEAMEYARANRTALEKVPVALFCVHAMNCGADAAEASKRHAYLDGARSLVDPVAGGFFAGSGPDPRETSWLAMWAFRHFGGHVVEGDGRDWPAIAQWARGLEV